MEVIEAPISRSIHDRSAVSAGRFSRRASARQARSPREAECASRGPLRRCPLGIIDRERDDLEAKRLQIGAKPRNVDRAGSRALVHLRPVHGRDSGAVDGPLDGIGTRLRVQQGRESRGVEHAGGGVLPHTPDSRTDSSRRCPISSAARSTSAGTCAKRSRSRAKTASLRSSTSRSRSARATRTSPGWKPRCLRSGASTTIRPCGPIVTSKLLESATTRIPCHRTDCVPHDRVARPRRPWVPLDARGRIPALLLVLALGAAITLWSHNHDPRLEAPAAALQARLRTSYAFRCSRAENRDGTIGLPDVDYVCVGLHPQRSGYWVGTDRRTITGLRSMG